MADFGKKILARWQYISMQKFFWPVFLLRGLPFLLPRRPSIFSIYICSLF